MRRILIGCIVVALPLAVVCSGAICGSYAWASRMGRHTIRYMAASDASGSTSVNSPALFALPSPAVSEVSPSSGPFRGGTPITISGTGFVQGDSVVIGQGNGPGAGAIAATGVSVVSSTQITATTGGGAQPGTWNVFVIAPGGTASPAVSSSGHHHKFTYTPAVSTVSPNSGPVGGGTPITITGSGFAQGDTVVISQGNGAGAGAIAATGVSVVSSTQITATTGGGAQPGTWDIFVVMPNGTASQAVSGATFTYAAAAAHSLVVTKLGSSTGDASGYNTFGPWDQHVVFDGSYGIFAVVHTTQNEEDDPGCHCGYFEVMRSTDNGSTWTAVYNSQNNGIEVQDPAIDADASGDLYVTGNLYNASVAGTWQTYLWKFTAGSFSSPTRVLLNYGASKYSMIYDPAHNEVDFGLWEWDGRPDFLAVDASTLTVATTAILFHGRVAPCCASDYDQVEYPNLSIGPNGQVLFGWATLDDVLWKNGSGTQNYYDARFLVTTDGGATWDGPNGQVTLPIYGSDSNSYDIVNTSDPNEFEPHGSSSYKGNWNMLDTLLWNDNGVAAAYGGFIPQDHASFGYLDWSTQTWINRTDAQKTAEGDACELAQQSDGGLSQNASYTGAIYRMCHSSDGSHVLAMVSTDDGATWHTLAKSTWSTTDGWLYLDPSHVVGPNGELGAVFTVITSSTSSDVYFVHSQ